MYHPDGFGFVLPPEPEAERRKFPLSLRWSPTQPNEVVAEERDKARERSAAFADGGSGVVRTLPQAQLPPAEAFFSRPSRSIFCSRI